MRSYKHRGESERHFSDIHPAERLLFSHTFSPRVTILLRIFDISGGPTHLSLFSPLFDDAFLTTFVFE